MKIGKLVIAWRHEEQLLRAVEMGARAEIRQAFNNPRHLWTRQMVVAVARAAEGHIGIIAEELVKDARAELVDALMTELQSPETPLRTLLVKLIRATARDFAQQQAEDARTAAEAANPCVDGYTEHNFGEAGLTSCERCGTLSPDAQRVALAAVDNPAPRTPAEQITAAVAAAGGLQEARKLAGAQWNIKPDGSSEVDA